MDTIEIDGKLTKINGFLGAFAYDILPSKPDTDFSVVINNQRSDQPGEHWVALIRKKSVLHFIDSYGRKFNDLTFDESFSAKLTQYIGDEKYTYNKTWLQQLTSNTCAYYSVYFIQEMQERSFKSCLAIFGRDLATNDKLISNYMRN